MVEDLLFLATMEILLMEMAVQIIAALSRDGNVQEVHRVTKIFAN